MGRGPADFAGEWAVIREITGCNPDDAAHFSGTARLTPDGANVLHYTEAGVLELATGARFAATRSYLWRFAASGVSVSFADGRPFHMFDPDAGGAGSDHLCGADLYRMRYGFDSWPDWQVTWQVSGPAKDYALFSLYRRANRSR